MTVILDQITVPEMGMIRIQVDQSAEIRVSAETARKQVRRWLREDVSMMMTAETPTLTVTDHIVWRVPILHSKTHLGTVGQIGTVDVDVITGEMTDTALAKKATLIASAQAMSQGLPAYQPRQSVAETFIPQNLPRSPILNLPEA